MDSRLTAVRGGRWVAGWGTVEGLRGKREIKLMGMDNRVRIARVGVEECAGGDKWWWMET